jgi:hypothetical protein
MHRIGSTLRRPAALLIAVVAATDLAYRVLVRSAVRRGLGIRD